MKPVTVILAMLTALAVPFGARTFAATEPGERVIKITAHAFEYIRKEVTLKAGEPVVLELTSQDLFHGFNIPELGLRADLPPQQTARLRLVPQTAGTFEFHCDNFCGAGHGDMSGKIIVK